MRRGERLTHGTAIPTPAVAAAAVSVPIALLDCQPPDIPSTNETPHVLLIVVDTLRQSRLGCHGAARPTSPALDELAAPGSLGYIER
jgi:hypothetical protein